MRAFIAIELPKEIKNTLSQLQDRLETSKADVKWVEPQNIHLTLKFLGEIDEKKLEKITQASEEIAKSTAAFHVHIWSIGAFPRINFPRIIWVGIDKGEQEIKDLAQQLEVKISETGIPKEGRPFSSHITIGRARSNLNRQDLVQNLSNLINELKEGAPEFLVSKIIIFKSTLTSKGPIYEAVKEVSLKTT